MTDNQKLPKFDHSLSFYKDLYFSLKGRLCRTDFLIAILPVYILSCLTDFLPEVLAHGFEIFEIYLLFALAFKRVQDMGFSGWFISAIPVLMVTTEFIILPHNLAVSLFGIALTMIAGLLVLSGTKDENKYGKPTNFFF